MGYASQYGVLKTVGKAMSLVLTMSGPLIAETRQVVAFGDSLTQGYGLQQGEGFVPQLQAWLTAQGADVQLVNAGVSGDTTAGGLARVDWTLTPEVDAMIVALGGNDMLRGIDPAASKANLAGILDAAAARELDVLLVGMQAPGNFGPEYKARFDAMYPELAETYDAPLVASFFEGLGSADPAALQALMQRDNIHPNADGVAQIVQTMGPQILAWLEKTED